VPPAANNISSLVAELVRAPSARGDSQAEGRWRTQDIRLENGGTVRDTSVVEGTTIEADHVLIEGKVRGTVIAGTLEITGSATLIGDAIYDALLDVRPRARLRGRSSSAADGRPRSRLDAAGTGARGAAPQILARIHASRCASPWRPSPDMNSQWTYVPGGRPLARRVRPPEGGVGAYDL
jgi:hypothetical protein